MSDFLIFLHSWLRWAIVILGIVLIAKGAMGMGGSKDFSKSNNTQSAIFTGLFHLQVLLGLILYFFISDITAAAFQDFGGAMKNAAVRYWAVEHITVMILAAVLVQVGRIRIKKADTDKKKFRSMFWFFLIAMLLVASRIPWTDADRMIRGL